MPTGIKIADVMRKDVITVSPEDNAEKALKYMVDLDIGSVIVAENHKPIGIVTDSNLLARVFNKKLDPSTVVIKDIMSSPVRTTTPDEDLEDACKIMRDLMIKRLPVLEEGRLIGIVSETDIIAVSPAVYEIVAENVELRLGLPEKAEKFEKVE